MEETSLMAGRTGFQPLYLLRRLVPVTSQTEPHVVADGLLQPRHPSHIPVTRFACHTRRNVRAVAEIDKIGLVECLHPLQRPTLFPMLEENID
jgi:hypothetical protein